jgi:L-amino acid N-acyltransferase YncA
MVSIRPARIDDAAALLAVYRPWVEASTVSFEYEAPTVAAFAARIERCLSAWTWLVAELDGECVGYAYGGSHRERAGYRWSVETSAYLRADQHGRGLGSALYTRLLDDLTALGYCNAYAGITLPNDASLALHRRMGFTDIGRFERIGWKNGAWHDVAWLQRRLRDGPAGPLPAPG